MRLKMLEKFTDSCKKLWGRIVSWTQKLKQSVLWKKLSSAEEPLNIRNTLLSFAGIVGLVLAGWRSWAGERQTKAPEEKRLEERRAERERGRGSNSKYLEKWDAIRKHLNSDIKV